MGGSGARRVKDLVIVGKSFFGKKEKRTQLPGNLRRKDHKRMDLSNRHHAVQAGTDVLGIQFIFRDYLVVF